MRKVYRIIWDVFVEDSERVGYIVIEDEHWWVDFVSKFYTMRVNLGLGVFCQGFYIWWGWFLVGFQREVGFWKHESICEVCRVCNIGCMLDDIAEIAIERGIYY
jgi:hypothetical protein